MRTVALVAAFLLGGYLSVRVLAALYGVLDLWYAVRRTWPQMVRGLVVWGGITGATAWVMAPRYRLALAGGLAAYVFLYLMMYALRDLGLRALARWTDRTGAFQRLAE